MSEALDARFDKASCQNECTVARFRDSNLLGICFRLCTAAATVVAALSSKTTSLSSSDPAVELQGAISAFVTAVVCRRTSARTYDRSYGPRTMIQ